MPIDPFIIIAVFLVVVLPGLIVWRVFRWFGNKRAKAYADWAMQNGFTYTRKIPKNQSQAMIDTLSDSFEIFREVADHKMPAIMLPGKSFGKMLDVHRKNRRVSDLLQGTVDDIEVSIFHYRFYDTSSLESNTAVMMVYLFQSEKLNLPQFRLLANVFGHLSVKNEKQSDAEALGLSERFGIGGEDLETLRFFFDNETIEFLNKLAPKMSRAVLDGKGNTLMLMPSTWLSTKSLSLNLELGLEIAKRLSQRGNM